jgi:adenosylmethionine-8-amino-7-oxononanoate aminotransferase
VLDIFRDDDVLNTNRRSRDAGRRCSAASPRHPKARAISATGDDLGFEVDTDRPDFARWCFAEGLARELLLRPIGRTVYFMPPYTMTDDEFALLAVRTREIVDAA